MLPKADIKPYAVDGKIEGLRITGLEDIEHMGDIGLENGDIIRTVNGHRLTSKQEAYQISKKARTQAVVSIELMRDNKTRTFSFHLS
jgi:general secretion pathway protein C